METIEESRYMGNLLRGGQIGQGDSGRSAADGAIRQAASAPGPRAPRTSPAPLPPHSTTQPQLTAHPSSKGYSLYKIDPLIFDNNNDDNDDDDYDDDGDEKR
ncbi:hypothetical protein HZH66_008322 [Vespula vulgaris]|uniref:Uncharacterized protein n=1 Tax=Vespula vulgaris TaxID=7454 RepID=A0A834N5J9_VESVU|nr:hypothetical protein HZH66_008322 [Vespula vulgaris]